MDKNWVTFAQRFSFYHTQVQDSYPFLETNFQDFPGQ